MYLINTVYNYSYRKRKDANTDTITQLADDTVQDPYEIISEHSITQNNQSSNWLPSQSASSPEIPDVEAYEEVRERNGTNDPEIVRHNQNDTNLTEAGNDSILLSQRYLNVPAKMSEEGEEENEEYEDVPDGDAYEPLKNVNYENTKNMDDVKVYTKLENSRRDSPV